MQEIVIVRKRKIISWYVKY